MKKRENYGPLFVPLYYNKISLCSNHLLTRLIRAFIIFLSFLFHSASLSLCLFLARSRMYIRMQFHVLWIMHDARNYSPRGDSVNSNFMRREIEMRAKEQNPTPDVWRTASISRLTSRWEASRQKWRKPKITHFVPMRIWLRRCISNSLLSPEMNANIAFVFYARLITRSTIL